MICIVYISSMKKEYSSEELYSMSEKFKQFNYKNNITGLMIYHNKNIMQYIEGEECIVKDMYKRITEDNRHNNIIKLIEEKSLKKRVEEWNVCFEEKSKYTFIEYVELCISNIQSSSLIKLFNIFIKVNIRYI